MELVKQRKIKPFVKWAGGKGQLIPTIIDNLPIELKKIKLKNILSPL